MTNVLEQAINCNDGDRAAKIIQDALGIENNDVVNYCFPWPEDREERARVIGYWLESEARFLARRFNDASRHSGPSTNEPPATSYAIVAGKRFRISILRRKRAGDRRPNAHERGGAADCGKYFGYVFIALNFDFPSYKITFSPRVYACLLRFLIARSS